MQLTMILKWKISPMKVGIPFLYPFLLFCILHSDVAKAVPKASFTTTTQSGCTPLNVSFINTSTGAVSYYWDLGNGNTSTLPNPANLYIPVGSYTITLIATDGTGAKDTVARLQIEISSMRPLKIWVGPPSSYPPMLIGWLPTKGPSFPVPVYQEPAIRVPFT
jgi:PKD repeat protein